MAWLIITLSLWMDTELSQGIEASLSYFTSEQGGFPKEIPLVVYFSLINLILWTIPIGGRVFIKDTINHSKGISKPIRVNRIAKILDTTITKIIGAERFKEILNNPELMNKKERLFFIMFPACPLTSGWFLLFLTLCCTVKLMGAGFTDINGLINITVVFPLVIVFPLGIILGISAFRFTSSGGIELTIESKCSKCGSTAIETNEIGEYKCPDCGNKEQFKVGYNTTSKVIPDQGITP